MKLISALLLSFALTSPLAAALKPGKFFLSSSAFMLMNLEDSDTNPEFHQLNVGYRLTGKDVVSVEFITWKYHAPLGIPYGKAKTDVNERFPGHVKGTGIGFAYQRFVWGSFYTALHTTFFNQSYRDEAGQEIGTGDQVFMTWRFLGYHFSLLNDRLFFEPNLAVTYWPVNTGLPESFREKDRKWPNYFLFEPGLHFGVVF